MTKNANNRNVLTIHELDATLLIPKHETRCTLLIPNARYELRRR
jgi:hypothetical protein